MQAFNFIFPRLQKLLLQQSVYLPFNLDLFSLKKNL